MSDGPSVDAARARQERQPSDYAGAIYGSLLAASVVAGTGPGKEPPDPRELIVLLLATGVVFWLSHVYAHLVGERSTDALMSLTEFRVAARRDWPIVQAAVPPAAAVGIGVLLGLSDAGAAWLALAVAVGSQMGWALYVAARAGATRGRMVATGFINLVLGLMIVALKAALTH
ncbi:hypothetical protein EV652_112171 [Kribbella steppae]|uniref:Integral membrane protein n=1 Tax=Kribbella steppae TaxID=2512223 RepID=A0A4R2H7K9_9ACTN|nr:hypothetical protein [Kribbella steppae]TCO20425.1 hypothetical protein EV652_112171 [Kribbella steppae]